MAEDFNCTINYAQKNKKFQVILDNKKTPVDLMNEFLQQMILGSNKITFSLNQKALNPNIPIQQQIKKNDTISMFVENDAGLGEVIFEN